MSGRTKRSWPRRGDAQDGGAVPGGGGAAVGGVLVEEESAVAADGQAGGEVPGWFCRAAE